MESFKYVNIFDTKGIEYIAVIAFLLMLIPFRFLVTKKIRKKLTNLSPEGALSLKEARSPGGYFLSRHHTWSFLEKPGTARVGLDYLLVHTTGGMTVRSLKKKGTFIRKGEIFAEGDQMGKKIMIHSPISGTITELNKELLDEPGLVYDDPFGKGWICRIEPSQWIEDTRGYYYSDKSMEWTSLELDRFREFILKAMNQTDGEKPAVIMQDGGEMANNALSAFPESTWRNFQQELLGE